MNGVISQLEATATQALQPGSRSRAHRDRRPLTTGPATGPEFVAAFLELQQLVAAAGERDLRWEAKAVAGIEAALGFAARDPAGARALTLGARRPAFGKADPERFVISYFARELGAGAPRTTVATPSDESVVAWIATVVRAHLLSGEAERLPDAAPDLTYLALAPRLGFAEACRWAELAAAGLNRAPA